MKNEAYSSKIVELGWKRLNKWWLISFLYPELTSLEFLFWVYRHHWRLSQRSRFYSLKQHSFFCTNADHNFLGNVAPKSTYRSEYLQLLLPRLVARAVLEHLQHSVVEYVYRIQSTFLMLNFFLCSSKYWMSDMSHQLIRRQEHREVLKQYFHRFV